MPERNPEMIPVDPQSQIRPQPGIRRIRNLNNTAKARKLLEDRGAVFQTPVSEAVAVDRAYTETVVLNDPASMGARVEIQKQGNVEDVAVAALTRDFQQQDLDHFGALDPEHFESLTPEQKWETINTLKQRVDWNKSNSRARAAYIVYGQFGDNVRTWSADDFDGWRREHLSDAQISDLVKQQTMITHNEMRGEVDEFYASQEYKNLGHAFASAAPELLPLYPIIAKVGLTRFMLESMDVPIRKGMKGWMHGPLKEQLREHLVEVGPEQYKRDLHTMLQALTGLEEGPVGYFLTKYSTLEQLDGIFTSGVLGGLDSRNSQDLLFSNIELGLEAVFSAFIGLKAAGKITIRGVNAYKGTTVAKAGKAAGVQADVADLQVSLQNDTVAAKFGMEAGENIPTLLPKPHDEFIDNMDELTDGTKDMVARLDRQRSEILEVSDSYTGAGLNRADKTNVITKTIKEMDIADGSTIQSRMSTIRMFDNDTGFRVTAVIGETADHGYHTIEDVAKAVLKKDPLLEHTQIVRVGTNGTLEPVFKDGAEFFRAVASGKFPKSSAPNPPFRQDFFIRYSQDRFWNQRDKLTFVSDTLQNAGNAIKNLFIPPNWKFGPEIYGSFLKQYMQEQHLVTNFEFLFKPYYKLGQKDKRTVAHLMEWGEDFSKDMITKGEVGRAPTLSEVMNNFNDVTPKQLEGYLALRQGYDVMHELFNRKLYREWQSLRYNTARPKNIQMPTYHGKVQTREGLEKGIQFIDPDTGDLVSLTARELDDLYNTGGVIMKLDMAIDTTKTAKSKGEYVLFKGVGGGYEIGELSVRPLKHMPNYNFRFTAEGYYVVKRTSGMSVNGNKLGDDVFHDEAVFTSQTLQEGNEKVARLEAKDGVTYHTIAAKELNSTESKLLQKQALQREGRLFWDARNAERLPDVYGNPSKLMDPVKALERGIIIASRQLSGEDLTKGMKNAFEKEFAGLGDDVVIQTRVFETHNMEDIQKGLKRAFNNELDPAKQKRLTRAIALIKYFRMMEGVDGVVVPAMRKVVQGVATTVTRIAGANYLTRGFEKFAQTLDPFRTMRSVAFHVFMVARPVRQALMQSAQIGYLAPLDPLYVGTGRIFKDSILLRRGLARRMNSAFDDGITSARAAKMYGMSQKQYARVIEQFDRSGLMSMVDVHSFAGSARISSKTSTAGGQLGYRARALGNGLKGGLQKWGFNFGENNNLTFTFALALHKKMTKKGATDLMTWSKGEWDDLFEESSNLALGMVKVNNFAYQSGAFGVATQFLSFSHKAALGLVGANPATKGKAVKLILGTYALYGANMYGAREQVEQFLTTMGVADVAIPGLDEGTLVDLISAGIIDTTFNSLWDMSVDDWKDVDLAFMAPGFDLDRIIFENMANLTDDSVLDTAFGPFGNVFSKTLTQMSFVNETIAGNPDMSPTDKFINGADFIMRGFYPSFNDTMNAYMGWKLGVWLDNSGDSTGLRTTYNGLIARGFFGTRTKEELANFSLNNRIWEDEQKVREIVRDNQQYLNRLANEFHNGVMTWDVMASNLRLLATWYSDWPEGKRQEVLKRSLIESINNEPSPAEKFRDGIANNMISPDYEHLIDRMVDIPSEVRVELKFMLRDAWSRKTQTDKEVLDRITEE